jgi:ribosomal protein S6--L-glutamate ligase
MSDAQMTRKIIALESRLSSCRNVVTLGVKPNFTDYGKAEADLIQRADTIYYPSEFYAELFDVMGKKTFPSYHTYKCTQDKIKQNALFELLNIPHPRTRIFYGNRQKTSILDYFNFPFIAKIPRGSALGRGVYLINSPEDLRTYSNLTHVAYIQEYLPVRKDIRVVVVGSKVVLAYWRIASHDEFRCNISRGGTVDLSQVPDKALELALHTSQSCHWDDVGIDIIEHDQRFYVLEGNMKYGKEGFRRAGIAYDSMMEEMIEKREI